MATKTFIFMGYSMRDEDFREIWTAITNALGHFTKLAYAIDPHFTEETQKYWRERGIELVRAYDVAFLRILREDLEHGEYIFTEAFVSFLDEQRDLIISIHCELNQSTNGGVASAMYQDGLLHQLEDVLSAAKLGTKRKEDFERDLNGALTAVRSAEGAEIFIEVAYWTGRRVALESACKRSQSPIPPFFHPAKMTPCMRFIKG
jgi:hypothetical protein